MEGNPFWVLVKEIYPLFLGGCAIMGVRRVAEGVWQRLHGEEGKAGEAFKDVIVAFFFAHLALPAVLALWHITDGVGEDVNKAVEVFINTEF